MPGCPECAFLRLKHADADTHADLQVQLRAAIHAGKGELVTALMLSEAAALKDRDQADVALRKHQAVAHAGGEAKGEAV